jgi:transposase
MGTLAQLAEQFDVHPNQITSFNAQLEGEAADVFGPGGGMSGAAAVHVKSLHAKIRELTLENGSWDAHQGETAERKARIDRTHDLPITSRRRLCASPAAASTTCRGRFRTLEFPSVVRGC